MKWGKWVANNQLFFQFESFKETRFYTYFFPVKEYNQGWDKFKGFQDVSKSIFIIYNL